MKYRKQRIRCRTCKGYKCVAMLTNGMGPFQKLVGEPLSMIFRDAKRILLERRNKTVNPMDGFVLEDAIRGLDTTPCPWCKATGYIFEMRQLTPEEASQLCD